MKAFLFVKILGAKFVFPVSCFVGMSEGLAAPSPFLLTRLQAFLLRDSLPAALSSHGFIREKQVLGMAACFFMVVLSDHFSIPCIPSS